MTHRIASLGLMLVVLGCARPPAPPMGVRPGIDVLLADSARLIMGRRLGLLTNQTGVDASGRPDLERLLDAGAQVTVIFSPEHGYRGVLDQEHIGDTIEARTGHTVYSLYGAVRAPTADMLAGVEAIVVDFQDIGARPYTFISTVLLTMQAAAARGLAVILLDRPNPIGGSHVQGPVLDTAYASFVGMLPVPLRHGMTLGELARLGNDMLGIGAALTVVPAAGWRREQWFDETRLPWVRPSPNMPDLESASHYPGVVLFEGTNLSVGRGTPIAFQVIGAPWLDPAAVRARLPALRGVALTDTMVTPLDPPDGKYAGVLLPALRLRVTDRAAYDPTDAAVRLLAAVRAVHPDAFAFRADAFDRLAGGPLLREALEAEQAAGAIVAAWAVPLQEFRLARRRYLLYRQ